MAQIKKLAEGKYLIRVSKGTGKRRTYVNRTMYGTLASAKQWVREQETMLDGGWRGSAVTFGEYRQIWLGAIKQNLAPLTYDNYDGNLRRHASPLDALPITDVRTHHIQAIYNQLTPAVTRSLHATLHALFEHAIRKEYLRVNPCKHTDRPKKRKPSITVLEPDEARVFLEHCRSMGGLVLELALRTGMRPEEYLASRWSDLHDNDISVEQVVQYNRKGGGFYFAPPKTPKSRRRIPIKPDLRQRLTVHRREQNEHRLALKGTWFNHNLIFPNVVGNPQTIPNLTQRLFAPIVEKCEFDKHLTLYSLRHSFATLKMLAGEHPKVVADWLGHSSSVLTMDTYSHVLPTMQGTADEAFERLLRGAR